MKKIARNFQVCGLQNFMAGIFNKSRRSRFVAKTNTEFKTKKSSKYAFFDEKSFFKEERMEEVFDLDNPRFMNWKILNPILPKQGDQKSSIVRY